MYIFYRANNYKTSLNLVFKSLLLKYCHLITLASLTLFITLTSTSNASPPITNAQAEYFYKLQPVKKGCFRKAIEFFTKSRFWRGDKSWKKKETQIDLESPIISKHWKQKPLKTKKTSHEGIHFTESENKYNIYPSLSDKQELTGNEEVFNESINYAKAENTDIEEIILMDITKRMSRSDSKAIEQSIDAFINELLEDDEFLLPSLEYGKAKNKCGNIIKFCVKLTTGLLGAILCPFNTLFISEQPMKMRILAAMGTVPLSVQFNFELIDKVTYAISKANEKNAPSLVVECFEKYKESLTKSTSIWSKAGKIGGDILKTGAKLAAPVCGYFYAEADSLSAAEAGPVFGKLIGLGPSGQEVIKHGAQWGNFYFTFLAGTIFYLGAVDLISGELLGATGKSTHDMYVDKILDKISKMKTDKEKKAYLREIQFNSYTNILDLKAHKELGPALKSKLCISLSNIIPLSLQLAFTYFATPANNDTFSSKRIVINACRAGLTVAADAIHYDERVALGLATASESCCASSIKSLSLGALNSTYAANGCVNAATQAANGTLSANTAMQTANLAATIASSGSAVMGATLPGTNIMASTANLHGFTQICRTMDPNCLITPLAPTKSAIELSYSTGMRSGLMQGLGLSIQTVINVGSAVRMLFTLKRLYSSGYGVKDIIRIPPRVLVYKALGYGAMSVCMYFYLSNVYAIVPLAEGLKLMESSIGNSSLMGANFSSICSMFILGVPFIEGGEFLSQLAKVIPNGFMSVYNCIKSKSKSKSKSKTKKQDPTDSQYVDGSLLMPNENLNDSHFYEVELPRRARKN